MLDMHFGTRVDVDCSQLWVQGIRWLLITDHSGAWDNEPLKGSRLAMECFPSLAGHSTTAAAALEALSAKVRQTVQQPYDSPGVDAVVMRQVGSLVSVAWLGGIAVWLKPASRGWACTGRPHCMGESEDVRAPFPDRVERAQAFDPAHVRTVGLLNAAGQSPRSFGRLLAPGEQIRVAECSAYYKLADSQIEQLPALGPGVTDDPWWLTISG